MTLDELFTKIKNSISQARVTKVSTDDETYPSVQVSSHKKVADVTRLLPYPLIGNPRADALGVQLTVEGMEQNRYVLLHDPENRLKGLKEGEGGIHNALTGSFVLLEESGDVHTFTETNAIFDLEKIAINNSSEELIDLMNQLVAACEAITVTTITGVTPPLNKATFTDLIPKFQSFKV